MGLSCGRLQTGKSAAGSRGEGGGGQEREGERPEKAQESKVDEKQAKQIELNKRRSTGRARGGDALLQDINGESGKNGNGDEEQKGEKRTRSSWMASQGRYKSQCRSSRQGAAERKKKEPIGRRLAPPVLGWRRGLAWKERVSLASCFVDSDCSSNKILITVVHKYPWMCQPLCTRESKKKKRKKKKDVHM